MDYFQKEVDTVNCKTLCAKSAVLLRPSDFLTGGV